MHGLLRELVRARRHGRPRGCLRPRRVEPPPSVRGRHLLRLLRRWLLGDDVPRGRGHRLLVRRGRHALRPAPLPVQHRDGREDRLRRGLPCRLHLGSGRSDPRVVLHTARHLDVPHRRSGLQVLRRPRPRARRTGQEDVEVEGKRGRHRRHPRQVRRRRLPLVLLPRQPHGSVPASVPTPSASRSRATCCRC